MKMRGSPRQQFRTLYVDKPAWWKVARTCNDVCQVENKIKFLAASARRRHGNLIFHHVVPGLPMSWAGGLRDGRRASPKTSVRAGTEQESF